MIDLNKLSQIIDNQPEFEVFYNMLIECNQKFNLTAITQKDEVYLKHFLDSVTANQFIPDNSYVLDIGCGAGFPSVPLKIIRPDLKFLLVDSSLKKLGFVDEVIKELDLHDINTLHTRIEDLKQKDFDCVVARAVAPLNVLCEYALPFLKLGGLAVFYKADIASEAEQAAHAIKFLGGEIIDTISFDLKGNTRTLVLIKKTANSPKGYPRPLNKPRKNPL
jgi:16S rRNA (guanine527-N7)-methyltransferase